MDVSYINQLDYSGNSSVLFKINHHIKHPPFIRTEEILALLFFSLVMYLVNLWVVIALIKPITTASQVLQQFKTSGGKMPDASTFISTEMKEFSTTINRIVGQLEDSQQVFRWQSEHDPLTRISNRRHLEKQLKSYLSDRPQDYLVLFLGDIDFSNVSMTALVIWLAMKPYVPWLMCSNRWSSMARKSWRSLGRRVLCCFSFGLCI